jgi:mercuric ion binding protein
MKQIIYSLFLVLALGMNSCKNETKKENQAAPAEATELSSAAVVRFGVRGNCSMCKKTIETAASSIEGVLSATWDVNRKFIEVGLSDANADLMPIHNAIAASGYDTEKVNADPSAYEKLPLCCQYDHSMEMNQAEHDHEMEAESGKTESH